MFSCSNYSSAYFSGKVFLLWISFLPLTLMSAIHRLDRLVSGLLILARSASKADSFRQQVSFIMLIFIYLKLGLGKNWVPFSCNSEPSSASVMEFMRVIIYRCPMACYWVSLCYSFSCLLLGITCFYLTCDILHSGDSSYPFRYVLHVW